MISTLEIIRNLGISYTLLKAPGSLILPNSTDLIKSEKTPPATHFYYNIKTQIYMSSITGSLLACRVHVQFNKFIDNNYVKIYKLRVLSFFLRVENHNFVKSSFDTLSV